MYKLEKKNRKNRILMIMLMSLLLVETMKAKALVGQSKFVI